MDKINIDKVVKRMVVFPLVLLVLLVSCQQDFKVFPIALDMEDTAKLDGELYIKAIDFRYLERGNKNFNEVVFALKPLNTIFNDNQKINLEDELTVDIWLIYKNEKYKIFKPFLSIHNMYEGESFSVECRIDFMDTGSGLYSFFEQFDEYSTKGKIEKLKQEIPKMKVFIRIGEETVEVPVTNKTEVVYTKIPNHMRNIVMLDSF